LDKLVPDHNSYGAYQKQNNHIYITIKNHMETLL